MKLACFLILFIISTFPTSAFCLTANRVWFEFHPRFFRVKVEYTVPALKEFREATVDFKSKRKAEKFYFSLLRGAEFRLGDPNLVEFVNSPKIRDPW